MKKLLYYITDHGLGHATRSIAIIRELQKLDVEIIVRNSNVTQLFKNSIPGIKIQQGITDVGPTIKKNGISIDEELTKKKVGEWIVNLNNTAQLESEKISKINANLIISDISAMPFLAAKKIHTNSLAISNFTWSDVLKGFPHEQILILNEAYHNADLAIQLPLGTKMDQFREKKQVGFVCRTPTLKKGEVKKKLGIKESELCVFINLGEFYHLKFDVGKNVKIISTGARVNSDNVVHIKPWIEGQNLVSASDLVISKCGYGMISECITNGIPFYYLSDEQHQEQKAISNELRLKGLNNKIYQEQLNDLNLSEEFILSQQKLKTERIDTNVVVNTISEMLN